MSVVAKPGARLRSVTCATEVVVVKGAGEVDLRCGGEPMVPSDDTTTGGEPAAPFDEGTLVGKRYVTEDEAIELLCTKPGRRVALAGRHRAPREGRQAPPVLRLRSKAPIPCTSG